MSTSSDNSAREKKANTHTATRGEEKNQLAGSGVRSYCNLGEEAAGNSITRDEIRDINQSERTQLTSLR